MLDDLISGTVDRFLKDSKPQERPTHAMPRFSEGSVKDAKLPMLRQIKDIFIEESFGEAKRKVASQIVAPGLKELACEAFVACIQRMFYGGDAPVSADPLSSIRRTLIPDSLVRRATGSIRDYAAASEKASAKPAPGTTVSFTSAVTTKETRAQAQRLLDILKQAVRQNGDLSVAELYHVLDNGDGSLVSLISFPDNSFGWENLENVPIVRTAYGYLLDLPKPVQLKQKR